MPVGERLVTDLASLRIAEDRIEWSVKEARESGDVYWDTHDSREDAERDLAWWRRKYPLRRFPGVGARHVITTEWADADE